LVPVGEIEGEIGWVQLRSLGHGTAQGPQQQQASKETGTLLGDKLAAKGETREKSYPARIQTALMGYPLLGARITQSSHLPSNACCIITHEEDGRDWSKMWIRSEPGLHDPVWMENSMHA